MNKILGECSLCGGLVKAPRPWWGGTPPPLPTCTVCGATEKLPVIEMVNPKEGIKEILERVGQQLNEPPKEGGLKAAMEKVSSGISRLSRDMTNDRRHSSVIIDKDALEASLKEENSFAKAVGTSIQAGLDFHGKTICSECSGPVDKEAVSECCRCDKNICENCGVYYSDHMRIVCNDCSQFYSKDGEALEE